MVKEFGEEKGELRISDYLTTNYDVPNFILNALDNNQDFPWMNKNRKRKTVHGDWQRHLITNLKNPTLLRVVCFKILIG